MEHDNSELSPEEEAFISKEVEKRQEAIQTAITLFIEEAYEKYNDVVVFHDGAAENIANYYFAVIYKNFKRFVDKRIESSKVASGMEMAVILTMPVKSSSNFSTNKINSIFAYHLGAIFSIGLKEWNIANLDFPNKEFEEQFTLIIRDHRVMLEGLISHSPLNNFPLASNAQYWKLLEFIFSIRVNLKSPP